MDVVMNASQDNFPAGATTLNTQGDFWLNVLVQLGQDPMYTPLADFVRLYHHLDEGQWLLTSPIHWQVTHHDAMMTAFGDELHLDESVAHVWFAEISQFLAQDGLTLIDHSPYYWLLNAVGKAPLTSPNLPVIKHQSLMPILAELDSTMYWQRLLTELQMYLATHPLNTARDRVIPINGVWFWGGGHLRHSEASLRPIFTDDLGIQSCFSQALPLALENEFVNKNTLFSIRYPKAHLVAQLEKITRQTTVNWYWNNRAYQIPFKPWYKRLWCQ